MRLIEDAVDMARSDSLSPVPSGEGWGEGPSVSRRGFRAVSNRAISRKNTPPHVRPLILTFSPGYRGEGTGADRQRSLPRIPFTPGPRTASDWAFPSRHLALLLLLLTFVPSLVRAADPATAPAVDPQLMARLTEIDARAATISTLAADFEQRKFTALMRKPLVSNGQIRVKGATLRWDTDRPEKTVLLITDADVRLYYPAQASVEIYTIDQRMAQLASSPLPRLTILKERFSFTEIPAAAMDKAADAAKFLALKLTPIQDELRQHVREVRVLLDIHSGYIVQGEFTDADGDRAVIRFTNVRTNVEIGDLQLKPPPGTKITRPLEGLPNKPR